MGCGVVDVECGECGDCGGGVVVVFVVCCGVVSGGWV